MDFKKPLEIVVIGGSLAALFASAPLLRLPAKHRITILERSPTPLLHSTGAGIVAGSETLEWFHRFDKSNRVKPDQISIKSLKRYYLNKAGDIIDEEFSEQRMTSWELAYYLSRWSVDGLQSDYVDADSQSSNRSPGLSESDVHERIKYEYGVNVVGIEDAGEFVKIRGEQTSDADGPQSEVLISAHFVIIADGPSSKTRKILLGSDADERRYAGYVAFRGTVPEQQLSTAATEVFVERFTFFHGHDPNTQILAYTIPGPNGTTEPGERLVNWVWYWNFDEQSEEYDELMTDNEGKRHRLTVPTGGKMSVGVIEKQKELARNYLPPQFVELIEKTEHPFVQAVTDLEPPPKGTKIARLLDGKAVIVGDALAGFRPHTAASTSQAALHGLLLERLFKEEVDAERYEQIALDHAWTVQQRGVTLGNRSQFGMHPLAEGASTDKVNRNDLWMRDR